MAKVVLILWLAALAAAPVPIRWPPCATTP